MDEPFIGMICAFGFNWPPRDWAQCAGQIVSIAQNTALFSLLGTNFGGNARTDFGLPDMRGVVAVGWGQHPGSQVNWQMGQKHLHESSVLSELNMPTHSHTATFTPTGGGGDDFKVEVSTSVGTDPAPATGSYFASATPFSPPQPNYVPAGSEGTTVELGGVIQGTIGTPNGTVTLGYTGVGESFDIIQPIQAVGWCIALEGLYPTRN